MNWSSLLSTEKKSLVILLDPDKYFSEDDWLDRMNLIGQFPPDAIFLGGSHLAVDYSEHIIRLIHKVHRLPIIAFPGDFSHIHPEVDGALFLSLISGRNSEYLINQHVKFGIGLRNQGTPTLPTGYMLIDGGKMTSVAYVTQTQPIPRNKTSLAVATAVAGEMLGLKAIYLEAGSGALESVPLEMVKAVKNAVSIPLIVGGGIRTAEAARKIYEAGADTIVVGNGFEKDPGILREIANVRSEVRLGTRD